jgi:hypothetical protein
MVVVSIDPYAQGASSASAQRRSASVEGYGVIPMVEYIADTPNLNYVEKTRIGAAGYSAGGNAVIQAASFFGRTEGRLPLRSTTGGLGRVAKSARPPGVAAARGPSRLAAVFVGGYLLSLTDDVLGSVRSSVAIDYARHDEGAFRNVNGNADLTTAPEALRLVNSAAVGGARIFRVEVDRVYGDPGAGTMRVVHNTNNIHPLLPYDRTSVAHLVDFFSAAVGLQPHIPATDQIWMLKEGCTLIALVGDLLLLVPLTKLLLRVPAFGCLVHPVPRPIPALRPDGLILFWAMFTVSALLACGLFMPMVRASAVVFPAASSARTTWWFPARVNNAVLLWALVNGVIGLALCWLSYRCQVVSVKWWKSLNAASGA